MEPISSIGVPLEIAGEKSSLSQALLGELAEHLTHFAETGRPYVIDLSSLPVSDQDLQDLEQQLGQGEVDATLTTIGESKVYETQYSGIWWIKHYSPEQKLMSQFIEINDVPEIIKCHTDDIRHSAEALLDASSQQREKVYE
jgi:hydrogenase-1 operon protein HyaF